MANWYVTRNALKTSLGMLGTATAKHDELDDVIEAVSRLIDDYLGFHAFPASGTRYYTPTESNRLYLDFPLVNVDAIQTTSDGSTYGTTMTTLDYFLRPYNATEMSPTQPWWEIEINENTTSTGGVFPTGIQRGVRVLGTWGYFDEREEVTVSPASGVSINATQTTMQLTNSSLLYAGQTIRMGTEQIFLTSVPKTNGSDTATNSDVVTGIRARNGTTGATHSSNSTVSIYRYPIIGQAALYQTGQDFRTKDAPLGIPGADILGGAAVRVSAQAGLHPFTRRMLDSFRTPVAI